MNYELPSGWITHNSRLKTHNSFVLCGENQKSEIKNQKSKIRNQKSEMKKELWSKILNIIITVLTAIATTFGVTSCMGV